MPSASKIVIEKNTNEYKIERYWNFNLEEVDFGSNISLNQNEPAPIALIQLQKGIKRESFIQEPSDLWEKSVNRYYDYNLVVYNYCSTCSFYLV